MIKLYYSPGACSLAPHIMLEELGVPYQLELVSIAENKTDTPEFRAINPKGRVPVLEDGKSILTEAPAILVYLSLAHADKGFLPTDTIGQFRCLEWFNWLSGTVHAVGYGQLWRPERFINDRQQHEQISAKGKENIIDSYRHIEKLLSGRAWGVGNSYSCVDPYLLVFYFWGVSIGLNMAREYPSWSAHAARTLSRGAVQRAIKQEGLPI
jgi:glutathione S-transferase